MPHSLGRRHRPHDEKKTTIVVQPNKKKFTNPILYAVLTSSHPIPKNQNISSYVQIHSSHKKKLFE